MVGSSVSHYRILGVLGSGGMGEVYAAVDDTLGRRVALKAIRAERRLSPTARARFLREARILSQLDHPHICRVYEYVPGVDEDFLVLELVEGQSLRKAMRGSLSKQDRLRIARQITDVLVLAHAQGIVHRDLKPDNVMLARTGAVKVLDFGLAASRVMPAGAARGPVSAISELPPEAETIEVAGDSDLPLPAPAGSAHPSLTMAGAIMGTLQYMSPEQARGEVATPASDMYSLGLMLQELFTGVAGYDARVPAGDLLHAVRHGQTQSAPAWDSHLTALIARLKEPDPAARPTAKEALDRLEWIGDKPRRRRRALAAAALVLIAALTAVKYAVDLTRERTIAVAARDEAQRRRDQAEDLIGFMLGDLRARLEPVGRLDVLDEVGARAMKYFAAVPEGALSDEELFRRSEALRQIGQVRSAQGSLTQAAEAFAESLRLAGDLARRDPDHGRWQVGLAASHFWLGVVHYYRSDYDSARAPFESYLAISRRLVEREPGNAEYRLEFAYANSNLGQLEDAVGNFEAALAAFRRVLEIKEQIAGEAPGDPARTLDVAVAHNTIGVVLEKQGNLAGAVDAYRSDLALRASLAARDPANMSWRNYLAISHMYLGNALRRLDQLAAAAVELERAQTLFESLTAQDPANTDWRRGAAVARRQLALVRLASGEITSARALLDGSTTALESLAARDGTNADWSRQLALTLRARADVLAAQDRRAEALRDALRSVELLTALHQKSPNDRRTRAELVSSHVSAGAIHARAGAAAEAGASWARARELARTVIDGHFGADIAAPYAIALIELNEIEQASGIVDTLRKLGFHDRDLLLAARRSGLL